MLKILEINKLIANAFFVASVFNDSLKISKFIMICMESHSSVPGWQEFFLIQILLIFSGRCNCYFDTRDWKFTGYQKLIWYALSAPANKHFQKRTIFVFAESWSRDQLL